MKKLKNYLILFLLLIGSMYYTNKSITTLNENDSIMQEIKKTKEKYEITPVNAMVEKDWIIPGVNGITIDYEKSYHNMKKYGSYNESLTVLKEIMPTISIENHYEYPITKGNSEKREVAFIIKVEEKDPSKIMEIINQERIVATFFIDGDDIEKYASFIRKYSQNEYEISSFQKKYNTSMLKASKAYLENITKQKTKYCYIEEENKKLEKFCVKEKMHRIKPIHIEEKNMYQDISNTLENGMIYSIKITEDTEKELKSSIDYIKKRGYQFSTLKELLKESI